MLRSSIISVLCAGFLIAIPLSAAAQGSVTVEARPAVRASVAKGASRVPMLTLHLEASCDDAVQIRSITVHHRGTGPVSDITGVYIVRGMQRLTRPRTFPGRIQSLLLPLRSLTLAPCAHTDLGIFMDISAEALAGAEHSFSLLSPQDFDVGKAFLHADLASSSVAITPIQAGSLAVAYRSLQRQPSYGDDRILARLVLTADGQFDQRIQAITLTNDGSASDADLQRLWLSFRGSRISALAEKLDGDRVRLRLDPPFLVEKHKTALFELRGDVRAGVRRTVRFLVEEPGDIEVESIRGRAKE